MLDPTFLSDIHLALCIAMSLIIFHFIYTYVMLSHNLSVSSLSNAKQSAVRCPCLHSYFLLFNESPRFCWALRFPSSCIRLYFSRAFILLSYVCSILLSLFSSFSFSVLSFPFYHKYPLLLERIIHYTPEGDPERPSLLEVSFSLANIFLISVNICISCLFFVRARVRHCAPHHHLFFSQCLLIF